MKKVTLKWHKRRIILKFAFIQTASLLLSNYVLNNIGELTTEKELWTKAVITSNVVVAMIFVIIYMYIIVKSKNKKYFVFPKDKICVKNEKRVQYEKIKYEQTLMQKFFGLVTLIFRNNDEKIVLRDVSEEALKYLE